MTNQDSVHASTPHPDLVALWDTFGMMRVELIEWEDVSGNLGTGLPKQERPMKPFKCKIVFGGNDLWGKIVTFGTTWIEAIQEAKRIADQIEWFK